MWRKALDKNDILFQNSSVFKVVLWVAALGVAACSAYYSIFGLSKLFAGAGIAVVLMASALEFGKLISATFLHRYWETAPKILKVYLSFGVVVLMGITSAGVYGFLSSGYQVTANKMMQVEQTVGLLQSKRDIFVSRRESLQGDIKLREERVRSLGDIRKSQENNYSRTLLSKKQSSTRRIESGITSTEKNLTTTLGQIDKLNEDIKNVSDSIAAYDMRILETRNADVAAELGPLLYLSKLTGWSMDVVINWFVLMIVFVFDPLALSLVIAANFISTQQLLQNKNALQDGDKITTMNVHESEQEYTTNDGDVHEDLTQHSNLDVVTSVQREYINAGGGDADESGSTEADESSSPSSEEQAIQDYTEGYVTSSVSDPDRFYGEKEQHVPTHKPKGIQVIQT